MKTRLMSFFAAPRRVRTQFRNTCTCRKTRKILRAAPAVHTIYISFNSTIISTISSTVSIDFKAAAERLN